MSPSDPQPQPQPQPPLLGNARILGANGTAAPTLIILTNLFNVATFINTIIANQVVLSPRATRRRADPEKPALDVVTLENKIDVVTLENIDVVTLEDACYIDQCNVLWKLSRR